MSANKVYCLILSTLLLSCLIISNHRVQCGKLEKLAALALILRAQSGGLTGIGGPRYVPIPIYIKNKKKKPKKEKKEKEVEVIFITDDHHMTEHHHMMEPQFLHDFSFMNDWHVEDIKLPMDWLKHDNDLW